MFYLQRVPSSPLDRSIAFIWYCESEPRRFALERVLPNGVLQLIVNLKEDQTRGYDPETGAMTVSCGTVLSGISTRFTIIDTAEQECAAGVAFLPGGTASFFAMPAHHLCDSGIPLELAWNRSRAARLREQVLAAGMHSVSVSSRATERLDALEQAMADAWRWRGFDPAVGFALQAFADRPEAAQVAAVADGVGLSSKRLAERFKTAVGMAPKRYCRILRFQRALQSAERGRSVD